MKGESEVSIRISRVKEEHILYTLQVLHEAGMKLDKDGTDIGIDMSVETDRDGVERVHEFLDQISWETVDG